MTIQADTIELDRPRVLVRPWPAIAAALAAGVAVDLLAWGRPGGPGLSVALVSVVLAIAVTMRIHGPVSTPAARPLGAAAVMAGVPAIRASLALVGLSVFAWAVLVAVAVAQGRDRSGRPWVMARYLRAGFEWMFAAAEPVRMAFAELEGVRASSSATVRRALPLVRGLALSWVVLVFFTVLLSAADPIFGGIVAETLDVDLSPDRVIRFATVAGGAAWLVLGLSRRCGRHRRTSDRVPALVVRSDRGTGRGRLAQPAVRRVPRSSVHLSVRWAGRTASTSDTPSTRGRASSSSSSQRRVCCRSSSRSIGSSPAESGRSICCTSGSSSRRW